MVDAERVFHPSKEVQESRYLIGKGEALTKTNEEKFFEYGYLRDNPAGEHQELWYHEQGDRSWLVVTRDTLTHAITKVEMARDVARARGRSK